MCPETTSSLSQLRTFPAQTQCLQPSFHTTVRNQSTTFPSRTTPTLPTQTWGSANPSHQLLKQASLISLPLFSSSYLCNPPTTQTRSSPQPPRHQRGPKEYRKISRVKTVLRNYNMKQRNECPLRVPQT